MTAWGVIVCLAALAGTQVLAGDLVFPEDVQSQSSMRIVSGWEAREGQIPWQLSLRMVNGSGSVFSCGGSIIHPEWGMTAAHCTATRYTMVLRAGAVSLWRPELLFETTEYYNHPLYIDVLQTVVQPHDISLLKFPRAITFSDRVQPIRLQPDADRNRNYAGVRLEASGWGQTWTNGPSPDNLQWVYLRGVANLACWIAYGGSSTIVDSTICAQYYNVTSQSTCQGDSGGPLVDLEEDGKYTMVGVASFVAQAGCHLEQFPAGFIRPGHYHEWYRQVTGINFDWEHEEPPSSSSESSESSEETAESSEEAVPEPDSSEEVAPEPDTEESEEATPAPDSEEEISPEPETEEEIAPESEESEEATPAPDSEEEIAPEPETEEEIAPESEESEEATPAPDSEEEAAPEPETEEVIAPESEESEEATPAPDSEEEVAPEPETEEEIAPESEESEEATPAPDSEEEVAPEPETEEEIAPESEESEEAAPKPESKESEEVSPEPETEEEVAPETEEVSEEAVPEPEVSEEVVPEAETEEASAEATSEDNETPEESRFGFPFFPRF